jgi:hypothetical protein
MLAESAAHRNAEHENGPVPRAAFMSPEHLRYSFWRYSTYQKRPGMS